MAHDTSIPAAGQTVGMRVENAGFLLDRLGQDCSPLQFLRELTENGIQAIERLPDKKGEVIWDVDWNTYSLTGQYKLACTDTGVGMTGEEMERYINALSASMANQAHDANFGVGAKVAAATRNHEGLLYLSWKDGKGEMVHLWRDPKIGQYGLKPFQRRDGTFRPWPWEPIDPRYEAELKPAAIKEHGTMVILLGNEPDADTMRPPLDTPSQSRWVAKYLNTRYFRFPEGITVKAREGWENPRSDTDRNLLRTITGQKTYLDRHSISSGEVPLNGATAWYWVLKDESALTQNSGYIASSGHVAALFQDELYEMVTGRSGVARLQNFGVIFGHNRVVLYVEPHDSDDQRVLSNTARTQLLLNNEPLPWADWAAEFRANMPDAIKALMDEVTAGLPGDDHKQAIRDRLKQIRELFRLSRYRRTTEGDLSVSGDLVGGEPRARQDHPESKSSRSGGAGGRAGGIYALFVADDGDAGEEIGGESVPEVRWISAEDGTRTPPDLEDRAAKYLADQNLVLANRDFRVFRDMVDRWRGRYAHAPGAASIVQNTVEEWFEQALIETILGLQALMGSPEWSLEQLRTSWSEEALTAAVMQRYHIDLNVKRTLGSKLGSIRDMAS